MLARVGTIASLAVVFCAGVCVRAQAQDSAPRFTISGTSTVRTWSRQLEFTEKHVAGVKRLRSGIGRRQQVFQLQQFVVLVRDGGIAEALRRVLEAELIQQEWTNAA